MPISKYFKGKGKQVMSKMQKFYGDKKGKEVFHAAANKDKKRGIDTHPRRNEK